MAPDDHSGGRPVGPVVLRIKLRYDDVETMVQRFAPNVGKSGLFLPTKSIQPIGTEVKFELRLANDQPVLVGLGRVKHVKAPDPAHPKAAFGMAIELMRVSREGRAVIIKMIERRRALGLPDVAIPLPEDQESARRNEIESQPRIDASGVVRDAMASVPSMAVGEQVLDTPRTASGPIAVAKAAPPSETPAPATQPVSAPDPAPDPAPATSDGASGRVAVPALAPEPAKARRPRVADVIAKAAELSGPIVAARVGGLDDDVDVSRALARARALAGGDLDGALSALRDSAAAPIEISIEAASAELARQLGGTPIAKRERSGKWVPPPAIESRSAEPLPTVEPTPTVEPPPVVDAMPAADAMSVTDATPAVEPTTDVDAALVPAPESESFAAKTRAETEISPSSVIAAVTSVVPEPEPVPEPETTANARAYDDDATAYADDPAAEFASDQKTRIPTGDEALEALLPGLRDRRADDEFSRSFANIDEEQLRTEPGQRPSSSVMIDDNADPAMLARAIEGSQPAMRLSESDIEPIGIDDGGEATHIGAMPDAALADQLDRQLAEAEAEADDDFRELAQPPSPEPSPEPYAISPYAEPGYIDESYGAHGAPAAEEVSDFDVLAEADEADADLLSAHGEAEVANAPAAYQEPPPPAGDDFAARLDLGDDDLGGDFDEPHAFAQAKPAPQSLRYAQPKAHTEDLEDALAALDVDSVDQIGFDKRRAKRAPTGGSRPLPGLPLHRPDETGPTQSQNVVERARSGSSAVVKPAPVARATEARPAKGATRPPPIPMRKTATTPPPIPVRPPPKRATTDEGVLIDFDDDE